MNFHDLDKESRRKTMSFAPGVVLRRKKRVANGDLLCCLARAEQGERSKIA